MGGGYRVSLVIAFWCDGLCRLDITKPGWHAVHFILMVDFRAHCQKLEILNVLFFLDPVPLQRCDTMWISPHNPHVVLVGNCNFYHVLGSVSSWLIDDGWTEAGDAVSGALQFLKLPHLLPSMTEGALKVIFFSFLFLSFSFCWLDTVVQVCTWTPICSCGSC